MASLLLKNEQKPLGLVLVSSTRKETVQQELAQYLANADLPLDGCILSWWKPNQAVYPWCAKVARNVLAIPALANLKSWFWWLRWLRVLKWAKGAQHICWVCFSQSFWGWLKQNQHSDWAHWLIWVLKITKISFQGLLMWWVHRYLNADYCWLHHKGAGSLVKT